MTLMFKVVASAVTEENIFIVVGLWTKIWTQGPQIQSK